MPKITELHVNGKTVRVDADARRTLLSVLRDDLDLTGTKYGCGEGQCGACTVLLDGLPTHSCRMPVGKVSERKVTTIEGLEKEGRLHPLQEAFLELGAMQCAYCTSGMIMAGAALLAGNRDPSESEVVEAMDGNLCRGGTYPRIIAAIRAASAKMRGSPSAAATGTGGAQ